MYAFRLNVDQLELFYQVCADIKAVTEEERTAVLVAMAYYGQLDGVVKSSLSKEDYIKHLSEKFGPVLVIKKKE